MEKFSLGENEYVELKNLLKLMGLCENGAVAMEAVSAGLVKVDGNIELRRRCKIRQGQVVEFDGHAVAVGK